MSDVSLNKYNHAVELYNRGEYFDAYNEFFTLGQYKDSYVYMKRCQEFMQEYYDEATFLFNEGKYEEARELFKTIKGFSNALSMVERCDNKINEARLAVERERRAEEERVAAIARREREAREAREREAREREDERRRAIAERERRLRERRERNKGLFESVIQFIVIFLPAVLAIVLGIILYSNKTQITIRNHNFEGWATGYAFYVILVIPLTIVAMVKRCHRSHDDTTSRIFVGVMAGVSLLASLIGFTNAGKLQANFNPARDFVITFRYKKNTGTSYSTYNSELGFGMKNTTNLRITYIEWEAMMYNGTQRVGWYTIWHEGLLPPNQTTNTYVSLDPNDSGIYNTSYENMTIRYQILKLQFNNNYTQYEFKNSFRNMEKVY